MTPDELRGLMGAAAELRQARLSEVLALLDEGSQTELCGALELLGHWREAWGDAIPDLAVVRARALVTHRAPTVRSHACAALALLTPPVDLGPSVAALERALEDEVGGVRAEAAAALGDLGSTGAALRARLQDPEAEVRFEAAFALASSGQSEALAALLGFMADRRRRADAIEGLHRLGDRSAVGPLQAWVGSWRLGWVERQALDAALVALGDVGARARLLKACQRGRFERRAYAFHLAGRTGLGEAEATLWAALAERDESLWEPAAHALRALGREGELQSWAARAPSAQAALIRALEP